jgi:EAL domain-containing protein (putative c-di-GMP-specific phosphodiesterase class I)
VLEQACRQVKSWQRKLGKNMIVAVNLSARQFSQPDLIDQVRFVLHETNIEPSCLELEITESSAMHNAENTIHMLRDLKRLGVRIAMDDFGTGYSSLNYLKRFPIDTLKLDQSFVKDVIDDQVAASIVSSVIALSHDLDLAVVAEGVETEAQLEFLRKHGCDRLQGFLFSKPLPEHEVEAFVMARSAGGRSRVAGAQSVN